MTNAKLDQYFKRIFTSAGMESHSHYKGVVFTNYVAINRSGGAQCPAEPAVEEVGNGGVTTNAIRSLLLSPMQTYRPGSAMERQSHSEKIVIINDFRLFLSPFWRLFSVFYGY